MLFTPEEAPRLDEFAIPYSSAFSSAPGGMRYSDRRARGCVIDLRSDDMLHLICHALLMYAAQKALQTEVARLEDEKNTLNSRITRQSDRILGLERELNALRSAPMEPDQPVSAPVNA